MSEDMPKIDELLEPARVQVLNLAPNDILVISTDGPLSDEAAERIKRVFTDRMNLPESNKVLVLGDGLKVGVIHRTDA